MNGLRSVRGVSRFHVMGLTSPTIATATITAVGRGATPLEQSHRTGPYILPNMRQNATEDSSDTLRSTLTHKQITIIPLILLEKLTVLIVI